MDAFILEISTWQYLILLPLRRFCHLNMRNEVTGSAPVVPHVIGLIISLEDRKLSNSFSSDGRGDLFL